MSLAARVNIIFVVALMLLGAGYLLRPVVAQIVWAEEYKSLMYECDYAMRDHHIAKRSVERDASDVTVKNLQAAELSLLVCHDYDVMRKRLMAWGLNENALSLIGLEAMEEKAYDLRRFVEIHEIRY